jgi:ankyrin repeat protein
MVCCREGNIETVKYLIETMSVNSEIITEKGTPLIAAVESRNLKLVSYLISTVGCESNKADRNGITPLYMAAF